MATKGVQRPRGAPDDYRDASAVTPNDSVDLPDGPAIALLATVAGVVSVITAGSTTLLVPLAAGIPLRLVVSRVRAAGTTATGIVALYT